MVVIDSHDIGMLMINLKNIALTVLFAGVCPSITHCQISLDNATAFETDIGCRDALYDRSRNLIYASMPSNIGYPNGNSLAFIDPETLSVMKYVFIGSEPRHLKLSNDSSLIYVSLSGAYAFRRYNLNIGEASDLQPLFIPAPSLVEDLAIYPNNAEVVISSLSSTSSSKSGHLNVYNMAGQIPTNSITQSNSIAFVNPNTLITISRYRTQRLSFNGIDLVLEQFVGGLFGGSSVQIEAAAGLIYGNNGAVLDPSTLTILGTFEGADGALEPVPSLGITYFLNGNLLKVFDNSTYQELDRIELADVDSYAQELFIAGENKLGYYTSSGVLGIVEGIPVSAPCRVDLTGDGAVNYNDVLAFITAMANQNVVADFNSDGRWNFFDISIFLKAFAAGCI